jgi:hypothetical protein
MSVGGQASRVPGPPVPLVAALSIFLLLSAPSRGHAQTDPRLIEAVRQAQEGQGDSARAVVARLLSVTPATDSLYPQIVYTAAMVANDATEMRRQLQRVAVEYGSSSWADDALLRLVQMDYATRNLDGAARNLERLRLDYPATPLLPQAAYWAARTYFDQNNSAQACRWLADGMARAGSDIELQNQLGYLYQRCGAVGQQAGGADSTAGQAGAPAPERVDTTHLATADSVRPRGADSTRRATDSLAPPAAASAPPTPGPPARPSVYRVQLAAVATKAAADDVASRAKALGLTVMTVHEKGLYKVRAGEYTTRAAAQAAAAGLKAKLGGSPFAIAEPR